MPKKNGDELTRIYQGRVLKVTRAGRELPWEEGEKLIWQFHQLFQDAVNYYLLALAGMADDADDSPISRMRRSMKNAWEPLPFTRNGKVRDGMRESIARVLHCAPNGLTIESAIKQILGEPLAGKRAWNRGVKQIAEACEGKVVKSAKNYLPQLCDENFAGHFDFSAELNDGRKGIREVLALINEKDRTVIERKLPELQKKLQFTWGAKQKCSKEACFLEPEFRKEVEKAIYFFKSKKNENERLAKLAEDLQCAPMWFRKNVRKYGSGGRKEALLYAYVLFMAFGNYSAFEIIKSQAKAIEQNQENWGDVQPDDPLELSRGERKYVFKYFTALQDWNGLWKDFDKLAFQEALKTLNQFRDKESERKAELEQIKKCLKWMKDGVSNDGKPVKIYDPGQEEDEDGEERGSLPVFKGDKRWERLQCIKEQLPLRNDFTSDELRDYGLSGRTVRGAKDIFIKWNQVLAKAKNPEACLPELKNILKKYQKENQKIIGSVNLFNELLKPENFCIWDESNEVNHNSHASKNILQDAVIYYEYRDRVKELQEPIKFTPADARYSRRLADLKSLTGSKADDGKKMQWKNGYGVTDSGDILFVRLAAKDGNTGKWDMADIGLHFSAPRLKRDQLISCGMPAYCPPLAQALNPENVSDDKAKLSLQIKKAAVQLMPDFDRKGKLRFLLNFQPEVDVADIKKCTGVFFAADQFYGGEKQKIGLLWPDEKKDMVKWHKDGKAFNVVSVDLGQRTCGALSRIEVSPKKQDRALFVGNDGSRDWFAKRTFAQLLRLNGEDCRNGNGNE